MIAYYTLMLIGSHLSIAGGLHRALDRAHAYGFDCLAIFLRNQVQWKFRPLGDEAVRTFRKVRRELRIGPVVGHASYLVNLAGRAAIRRRSIAAMREDLRRCERLGVEYLVFHPGTRERTEQGIGLIADALNQIIAKTPPTGRSRRAKILLETTAGQGNSIGHTFEQLAAILALVERPGRFGICLDTCHVFAAGYDVRTPSTYRRTMNAFNEIIGLRKLLAIHVNDSRRELGARVDRHAHVGRGKIGRRGLRNFVTDPRLERIPMILETPKGADERGRDWDEINARALRRLVRVDQAT